MQTVKAPVVGQSVFIPFVTNGEGQRIKGASLQPFDVIDAVYSGREVGANGKPVYQVRVKSGDVVSVIDKDDKWNAIN